MRRWTPPAPRKTCPGGNWPRRSGSAPSTISRMANGLNPVVGAFVAMTTWLHMPAKTFYVPASGPAEREPELVASLAPLLRARRDLDETDIAYLEEVIGAAARRFRAERGTRSN